MTRKENLILELANLEVDSKIGKDRHFAAADRKNTWRIVLGVFSVSGTAIIASKALKDVFLTTPAISPYETVFISITSLLIGVSTAILGFLGLEKQITQHRLVGNIYIEVSRKARRLINSIYEQENIDIVEELNKLLSHYSMANKEGEACPTSQRDSKISLKLNQSQRIKIKNQIKKKDDIIMGIHQKNQNPKLLDITKRGLKIRAAHFFCSVKLISKEDLEKYIDTQKTVW